MRYRIALTLALLAAGATAGAAQEMAPPIAFDTFTLGNGLHFIVHEDRSTPVVAVNVHYDVGSANDPASRTGFAHLFEHMLFEETENIAQGEQDRLIQSAGGRLNGATTFDRTFYYEVMPANRINLALWIQAERMARLVVDSAKFAREREVVKEERRMRYENQPYAEGVLTMDTLTAIWGPYKHSPIGSMADLDAATVPELLEFYRTYYRPNNATVVVAGDVTTAQVRALAEQYFGAIPRGPEPPALPPMPEVRTDAGEKRLTLTDEKATLPLYLANYRVPPHGTPESYALQLMSSILFEGESSRLHRRLVKEEQAALQVFPIMDTRRGPAGMAFGALPNQGVAVERLEQLFAEEIRRLQQEGVTAAELEKAKNQARAGLIMGRQTVQAKAEELQHYHTYHGGAGEINRELQKIMGVGVADIRAVARTYLVPSNRVVVVIEPPARAAAQ